MIHEFTVSNFFSIADEQKVSFVVPKTAPKDSRFVEGFGGVRIAKVLGVFGPNASGKTNLLRAFSFLTWFIRSSFMELEKTSLIPYLPFSFSKLKDAQSRFSIIFELNKNLYSYSLALNSKCIVSEELKQKTPAGRFKYVYKRIHDDIVIGNVSLTKKMINSANLIQSNAAFLSSARKFDKHLDSIAESLTWINNVAISGRIPSILDYGLISRLDNDRELSVKIEKLIKTYDIGLESIKIIEAKADNVDLKLKRKVADDKTRKVDEATKHLFFIHKVNGKKYLVPQEFISSGSIALLIYLDLCLRSLGRGGLSVIDELGNDLHPHIIPKLMDIFISPDFNKNNAQLIFSSHTIDLFHELDKVQIILVERNDASKTQVYRLDDVENVRRDENIHAKYNSGVYGAVPVV